MRIERQLSGNNLRPTSIFFESRNGDVRPSPSQGKDRPPVTQTKPGATTPPRPFPNSKS